MGEGRGLLKTRLSLGVKGSCSMPGLSREDGDCSKDSDTPQTAAGGPGTCRFDAAARNGSDRAGPRVPPPPCPKTLGVPCASPRNPVWFPLASCFLHSGGFRGFHSEPGPAVGRHCWPCAPHHGLPGRGVKGSAYLLSGVPTRGPGGRATLTLLFKFVFLLPLHPQSTGPTSLSAADDYQ